MAPPRDPGAAVSLVNYEQMLANSLEVNQRLRPDVVVLDEAQRIKNWTAKTTQAIKRLRSRYAFILTGTPIENRIDELYSLMDFLSPSLLGPLFRFNREFYALDDHGRPVGYRNLDRLHERIRPHLLRRRKLGVETELPDRSDRNHFVPLSSAQRLEYESHEAVVARLASIARRRPLSQQEQDKLLRHLTRPIPLNCPRRSARSEALPVRPRIGLAASPVERPGLTPRDFPSPAPGGGEGAGRGDRNVASRQYVTVILARRIKVSEVAIPL